MNTQAELWPWIPEPSRPPERPRCHRCGTPSLADAHDPEAELRAEVRQRPQSGRRQRGPSHGATRL